MESQLETVKKIQIEPICMKIYEHRSIKARFDFNAADQNQIKSDVPRYL